MTDAHDSPAKPSNFLRGIIDRDLEQGTYASRRWAGSPGDAAHHAARGKQEAALTAVYFVVRHASTPAPRNCKKSLF